MATTQFLNDRGLIARYRPHLPVTDATPVISLNEGSTPLIHSPKLSTMVGRGCNVFIKYEGLNPTGSFKDRGMTVAISKAAESGSKAVICASTGNTSAAAAAYAAAASASAAAAAADVARIKNRKETSDIVRAIFTFEELETLLKQTACSFKMK